MKTLLLIDGNAIMHRAYHALPPFKTRTGIPTGAVFGFFSILHKSIIDFKPEYLAVCFDTPAPTFRKKMFNKYQAQRPKLEDDIITQFPIVREGLDAAHVFHIEKPGFEADDLIGTISHHFDKNGLRVMILSGDRDILQLVNHNILVVTPQIGFSKGKIYNAEDVLAKFGVTPKQIPDYKALAGDQSDNYKGAKGIGPKTAAKLINKFKSVENLYNNIDKLDSKIQTVLKDNHEDVIMSKKLAVILNEVELDFHIEKTKFAEFNQKLKDFFFKYEIHSLINRLFKTTVVKPPAVVKKSEEKNKNQMGLF